ncbi:hypothetical protein E8E12_002470 [Didymella heteroderae]|uniref:Uncharacterized protein n=1 Tax=Didymella heteroderae TaxID=1769908 RepID=A0A9P5BVD1_9PLEO|nr:hypothetical protein E8E12_002470 [Didymella heteroderae]
MFGLSTIALLALSPTVLGIAFPGPAPTVAGEANLLGRSPRPTGGPPSLPSLFRRQGRDEGMCGYLDGLSDTPVSCTVGTCLYDDSISWFGCCTGTARSDCALFTTCVGSASISSCLSNSRCANDDYALACTEATAGVCMTMWGEVQEGTVNHYVCGTASASVQVVATPTAGAVSTTEGSAKSSAMGSAAGLPVRSSTRASSSGDDSSATQTSRRTSSSTEDRPRINTAATATTRAPTTTVSTAGAVKSAQAVVGAVGGFAGFVAWFV